MSSQRTTLGPLLRWYPAAWRERYGDELIALLEDMLDGKRPPITMRLSVAGAGVRERARSIGLVGDAASPSEQRRTSALVVLFAWTLFVLAGCAFAKLSEHAGSAASASASRSVGLAYQGVEILALLAGVAVVVGSVLCVQPFIAYLRAGGWPVIRRSVITAGAMTAVSAAGTIGLVIWAHRLPPATRQSGAWPYGPAFLTWGATVALAIMATSRAAAITARRLDLSDRLLGAEVLLSRVVLVAMVGMTVATIVWWRVMAAGAPQFLGSPARIATVTATMLIADLIGVVGAARGSRAALAPV